jgi:hypothetical protein
MAHAALTCALRDLGDVRVRLPAQITDRLALAWSAILAAAAAPVESVTFLAGLQVLAECCDGEQGTLRRYGLAEFKQVRGVLPTWGRQRICHRIVARFHGALKLAGHALADLRSSTPGSSPLRQLLGELRRQAKISRRGRCCARPPGAPPGR